MLFISYFELNENMPAAERSEIAQKIMGSGQFPPPGINIIRWDSTSDLWGVIIFEAESAEDVIRTLGAWRSFGGGFFKSVKTSPAMPVQEIVPLVDEVARQYQGS